MVPLRRPLKFRVVYENGALVRSGVELSSSVVGSVPRGQLIVVDAKRYSNTPSYRCVPRLRLADGSGWISMRINSPPPADRPVVRLLGFADEADLRAYAEAELLGPPMADGAGMVEMEEEGDGDGYDEEDEGGSGSDDEEEASDFEEWEAGEEEQESGAELVLTGEGEEESRDATSVSMAFQQQNSSQEGEQRQRRRRRRRREELSSSGGSSGTGGGGGWGMVASAARASQRQHQHSAHKPLSAQAVKGLVRRMRQGGMLQGLCMQQEQQHEAYADNEKIVRALKCVAGWAFV